MADLIRTTAELEAACAQAKADGLLALDTEFVWMRTYRPILGIVQIGARSACWALDCMTGMDVAPLKAVLEDPTVVKILHDAHQDLTLVHRYAGALPRTVFDTQFAAAFAGFPARIGLQKLLFDAIDVGLPKTETRTDWTQRPLSPAQVRYALDDVRYLPALRDELLRRAEALGTRAFLEEDLAALETSAHYADPDPFDLWKRVKLHGVRLDGRGRAVLRAVMAVREKMARQWNLPRNWLGDDDSLVAIAASGRVQSIRHRLRGGQGDTIRAIYAEQAAAAARTPEADWPADPSHPYIREVREQADLALDWLEARAADLHVAPAILANRAVVTDFIDDVENPDNPLAQGWRFEKVGREMAALFGVD